jgi:phage terminase large subunit-like protein
VPTWSTACPDWRERLKSGASLTPPPIFPAEAAAALAVFNSLRIVDAPGSPTFGEASNPWVQDLVAAIFGAYDAATGRRLIREVLVLVSKKNSKSTLAAGIMVTALVRNWRRSGELYFLAPTLEVADNCYFPARDMVRAHPELPDFLDPKDHLRTIFHRPMGAFMKVIAADATTTTGKKGIFTLADELWLFGKQAKAENMLGEATGGGASRPEGCTIYLSTQSDEPPAGVFKDKLAYFRKVRDGEIDDPASLPVLYEFPPEMIAAKAYLDPANFRLTNPNLGRSVDPEWIARKLKEAQANGPHSLNVFIAKHLNVEIGQNLRADRWAGADFWADATDPTLTLETLLERSEVVVIGLDGGGLDDLLGLSVVGRESGTKRWLAWGAAFCHVSVLRRRKEIASILIDFARQGDLKVFDADREVLPDELAALVEAAAPKPEPPAPRDPDAEVELPPDIRALVEICARVVASGKLATVGIDPAGVGLIVEGLKTIGVWEADSAKDPPEAPLIGVSQGYKLMGPIKTAERMLADRTLVHAAQPLLAWAVGNAKTELKGNAVMITKAAAGACKIDPLMALLNGVALMSQNPEPAGSVYTAARGLTIFG